MRIHFPSALTVTLFLPLLAVAQTPAGPKLLSIPDPIFPEQAINAAFPESTVRIKVSIDAGGRPTVLETFGPLAPCSNLDDPRSITIRDAAIEVAKKALFESATGNDTALRFAMITIKVPRKVSPDTGTRLSGGVINGKPVSIVQPKYPDKARKAGVSGPVTIHTLLDEEGKMLAAEVVSGNPLLHQAAMVAACKSRYTPTTLAGQPVKVGAKITYNFTP